MNPSADTTPRCTVLGTDCYCGEPDEAVRLVLDLVHERAGGYVCFANAHVVVSAHHDEGLRRSLHGASLVFPDGAPVAWMQRRKGATHARRVPGPDVMPAVIDAGQALGVRHFLLGSTPDALAELRRRLAARFPAALIVGASSPRVGARGESPQGLIEQVRAARPHVVWCALGAPKQELWMAQAHQALSPALLLGVGAAFEFLAESKPRAPVALQEHGFEWLHRLVAEPRRLAGRYLRTNTEFVIRAAATLIRGDAGMAAGVPPSTALDSTSLALDALGGVEPVGRTHTIVTVRGRPRFVLPAHVGGRGPLGSGLFRPYRHRQYAAAAAAELLHRAGLAYPGRRVRLGESSLAGELARCLGVRSIELDGMVTGGPGRGRRAVLAVRAAGELVAFAKLALDERPLLERERAILDSLAAVPPRRLVAPRVLAAFDWQDAAVLVVEPLPAGRVADRPLGEDELAALSDLARHGAAVVARAHEGDAGDGTLVHGDFAPWNSARLGSGRVAVWDWEEARAGSPLEDVFHWQVQRHLRGTGPSIDEIVADAVDPYGAAATAARRLGVEPATAPTVLARYLDRILGSEPRASWPEVRAVRERGLRLLEAATG